VSAITFRVFGAVAGALLGLGAFVLACQALTLALIDRLGTVGGLSAAAATLLALAVIAFWFVSRPSAEVAAETEEAKSAAAGMIAGLPMDAVMSAIRKHPVAIVLAALLLGYTLIRDPGKAMRQMQSIVLGLL
jgi:hypothetical protein